MSEHAPNAVVTDGDYTFVECSCDRDSFPELEVWLSEHYGADRLSGIAVLGDVIRRRRSE